MTKENFLKLVDKYLEGKASLKEEQQLLNFYESFNNSEEWNEKVLGLKENLEKKMLARLLASIKQIPQKDKPTSFLWRKIIAAAVLLLICSTTFYYYRQKNKDLPNQIQNASFSKPILPGGNTAFLTLANGHKIVLNEQANEILAKQGNNNINVTDGKLTYSPLKSVSSTVQYNLIEVPKGGQYQINLPDGTKVWLNAESSLYYPSAFALNERKVKLVGEAYFEVTKDLKRPFTVESQQQQIEVLGTQFNVSAYHNDDETKTTLLEGSVKVSIKNENTMGENSQVKILKPGQQSIISTTWGSSVINVKSIDVDEAVAWKNGHFLFAHENIKSVMKKIERWYNVEISYQGVISKDLFVGTISRSKNLSSVLEYLELAGDVHFKIEERRIIVLP